MNYPRTVDRTAAAPSAYWREIAFLLLAKVLALALLYLICFAPAARVPPIGDQLFRSGEHK